MGSEVRYYREFLVAGFYDSSRHGLELIETLSKATSTEPWLLDFVTIGYSTGCDTQVAVPEPGDVKRLFYTSLRCRSNLLPLLFMSTLQ